MSEVSSDDVQVTCDFSRFLLKSLGNMYQCVLGERNFRRRDVTVIKVLGNHTNGEENHHVDFLDFSSIKCDRLPKRLHTFFKRVRGILARDVGLESLTVDDLKNFEFLEYVEISENHNLKALQSDLFSFNREMKFLIFASNDLDYLGDGLIDCMKHIQFVNFQNNLKLDESIRKSHNASMIAKLKENLHRLFRDQSNAEVVEVNDHWKTISLVLFYLVVDLSLAICFLIGKASNSNEQND
jgi:hypothetical protein